MDKSFKSVWTKSLLSCDSPDKSYYDGFIPYASIQSGSVALIERICRKFHYSEEIEFTCYENVDKFFKNYFLILMDQIRSKIADKLQNYNELDMWNKLLDQLDKENLLRIICVVILSAKFIDNNAPIVLNTLLKWMEKADLPCSVQKIQSSEFFVYSILEFKIAEPKAYFAILCFIDKCTSYISENGKYISVSAKVLRYVFHNRNIVYCNIAYEPDDDIFEFRRDQILLGGSVVLVAGKLLHKNEEIMKEILNIIIRDGQIRSENIQRLTNAIFDLITN